MNKIFINKLYAKVKTPTKGSEYSSGFDIYAYLSDTIKNKTITIYPQQTVLIPTGLKMQPPEGFDIKLYPRSGLSLKHGITLGNCVGVGDRDYPDEYGVIVHNNSDEEYTIIHNDKICQMMIEKVYPTEFIEVETLPPLTSTRTGGFGSTGK